MANLPEQPEYEEGIYQLEETDPVLGGPNGIDNLQAKQLANRTNWLKLRIEALQAGIGIDAYTQVQVDGLVAERLTQEQADGLYEPLNAIDPFVGFFCPFAGDTAPDGFLECNGAAISRTAYAALFAVIGVVGGNEHKTLEAEISGLWKETELAEWADDANAENTFKIVAYEYQLKIEGKEVLYLDYERRLVRINGKDISADINKRLKA